MPYFADSHGSLFLDRNRVTLLNNKLCFQCNARLDKLANKTGKSLQLEGGLTSKLAKFYS